MSSSPPKRAFVTGVAGQDGWYVASFLRQKGYDVYGCGRPGSLLGPRGDGLRAIGVKLVEVELLDRLSTLRAVAEIAPNEIYNLAGHSFVPQSWEDPATAIRITSWPAIHLMDAIRELGKPIRFYQASSSEIFGLTKTCPQTEETPMEPANPYAAAKVFVHNLVKLYRTHYGLFACSGILYNHESPLRPSQFVTAKVVRTALAIKAGKEKELLLGDLDVTRDWGYAGDYAEAMWLMLQQATPDDFIIGTGKSHTVRDLCRLAFSELGLDYQQYVHTNQQLLRPGQPTALLANPNKAKEKLGWVAATSFEQLIHVMIKEMGAKSP